MSFTAARTVNVSDLIEKQKVGGPLLLCGLTLTVMAWCFLTVMGDGYDYTAMAYAAPAVIKTMHVARGAMGNVFGAGLFGIMLGAHASFGCGSTSRNRPTLRSEAR